eukprot:gene24656-29791_t
MDNMKRWNQLFRTQAKYDAARAQVAAGAVQDPRLAGFYIQGEELWTPDRRVVVSPENVQATLEHEYDEHEIHFISGKGIKNIWAWLARYYINIDRAAVQAFLGRKGIRQVVQEDRPAKTRVVVAKRPLQFLSIDLVDMNGSLHFCLCRPLFPDKTALNNSSLEIDMILDDIDAKWPGKKVQVVITDNGGEFKGRFHEILAQKHIKHVYTNSHSPNEQSIVERKNRELRRVLRSFAVAQNSTNWWVNLDKAVEVLNQSHISTLGGAPVDLVLENGQTPRQQKLIEKGARAMQSLAMREGSLQIGDKVRVKMGVLFSDYRRRVKAKESKNLAIKYSPVLFDIAQKQAPRHRFGRWKYALVNQAGDDLVRDSDDKKVLFRYDSMLLADENDNIDMSMEEALALCKVEQTATDLRW